MSAGIAGRLDIYANGNVDPEPTTTSPSYLSLSGITFKAV
jgi:hypothetical protein